MVFAFKIVNSKGVIFAYSELNYNVPIEQILYPIFSVSQEIKLCM